ncbi:tyrosine-type recombinase/integrase [Methylotenera sp.]|uniref:tyrosine-type recombinase/integrase n=1 Tax=Methylotenera sp. TaxID=2051956 RepID=UPI0027335278|nr:tyrosine-type recombinase/integrase [Methylotenera sp.]MDP3308203.1 tyrosine-type recombinase/integrase [Methylotenera sp.]MDP3818590.1 tyrosine-type recombinase/integrase [Methylotenera sp.]
MSEQQQGKTYFSMTTKAGVELYLAQRWKDVEADLIVKGRHATIKTHLAHWLEFIKRDTKLKELERTDCENYFHSRTKTKKNISAAQSTIENEQSTINAMMSWLYKRKETYIDSFDFKKLKRIDRGDEDLRRASFTDVEIGEIRYQLEIIVAEAVKHIDERGNLVRAVVGYYLLILIVAGLRRGEQLQLRWMDIEHIEHIIGGDEENSHSLVKITVRAETSKVRKTRKFAVRDKEYFEDLFKLLYPRYIKANKANPQAAKFAEMLIFSVNGKTPITVRAIDYLFDQVLDLADVKRRDTRDLVPYSFRHYFITKRVNSGLHSMAVAEMCGTSTTQIEKTYYHTTREKMISNAMADYCYNKDGLLILL